MIEGTFMPIPTLGWDGRIEPTGRCLPRSSVVDDYIELKHDLGLEKRFIDGGSSQGCWSIQTDAI
jgi:hypothetical protein